MTPSLDIECRVRGVTDMPTLRTDMLEQSNTESVIKNLDMENELREPAAVRIASYHCKLANLYNRRVKLRMFQLGDLVLRKLFKNIADMLARKFHQTRRDRIL